MCVYIKEAHPSDGSQSPPNVDEGILYEDPRTLDERAAIAGACMLRFNFAFPMVLDGIDNTVEARYVAMPERLYLLDAEGKVLWKCGIGPHFFDVDGFERALEAATGRARSSDCGCPPDA